MRAIKSDHPCINIVPRGETTLSFESAKGGLRAHDLLRWAITSGVTDSWTDAASATMAELRSERLRKLANAVDH